LKCLWYEEDIVFSATTSKHITEYYLFSIRQIFYPRIVSSVLKLLQVPDSDKTTMKLSLPILAAAASFSPAMAFAPIHCVSQKVSAFTSPNFYASPLEEVGEPSEMSADPYEGIGISKDQLALGVDAKEFLKWIGT
jgi:hypothetical protein